MFYNSSPRKMAHELRELWNDPKYGPTYVKDNLKEHLELGRQGKANGLRPADFSVRRNFEETVEGGREIVEAWEHGRDLTEAVSAVSTTAFSEITGQLIFSDILRGYEDPSLIWPQLCRTVQTMNLNGEKIPGIGGLGDVAEVVGEGKEYPEVGLNQEYVETQPLQKRGFRVSVTKEIVIADRTGLLSERAGETGK